ncbi:MAG: septum site-determining protein MinD [Clostridia bacterium]|nr:septum site-determining protein MinD [Clostridia bacterium]
MGRIITVISGKGGVGKSTFSANAAVFLSKLNKRILLVDADINLNNLDLIMGIQDQIIFNASDVVHKRCNAGKAIIKNVFDGLDFFPGSINPGDDPTEVVAGICELLKELKGDYDIILIDCPSGVDSTVRALAKISDASIVVTTPDLTAIRDANRAAILVYGEKTEDVRLVVNRVRPKLIEKGLAPDIDEIIDNTEVQLLGLIPEDIKIQIYSNKGILAHQVKKSRSAKAFENISQRITGQEVPLYKFW